MKVYVVLCDYGMFDGGASIEGMFAQEQDANAQRDNKIANARGYPEYRVEEHTVN